MTKDELDNAVLACLKYTGEATIPQISEKLKRPYNTVMVRLLKLEVLGLVQGAWCHGKMVYRTRAEGS